MAAVLAAVLTVLLAGAGRPAASRPAMTCSQLGTGALAGRATARRLPPTLGVAWTTADVWSTAWADRATVDSAGTARLSRRAFFQAA